MPSAEARPRQSSTISNLEIARDVLLNHIDVAMSDWREKYALDPQIRAEVRRKIEASGEQVESIEVRYLVSEGFLIYVSLITPNTDMYQPDRRDQIKAALGGECDVVRDNVRWQTYRAIDYKPTSIDAAIWRPLIEAQKKKTEFRKYFAHKIAEQLSAGAPILAVEGMPEV